MAVNAPSVKGGIAQQRQFVVVLQVALVDAEAAVLEEGRPDLPIDQMAVDLLIGNGVLDRVESFPAGILLHKHFNPDRSSAVLFE